MPDTGRGDLPVEANPGLGPGKNQLFKPLLLSFLFLWQVQVCNVMREVYFGNLTSGLVDEEVSLPGVLICGRA